MLTPHTWCAACQARCGRTRCEPRAPPWSGCRGGSLSTSIGKLSPIEKNLFTCFKAVGNRVPGSPQSYARLRSEMFAYSHLWHNLGIFITINPSDLSARAVFEGASQSYGFSGQLGTPDDGCPSARERWRTVAANPVACAQYFAAFMESFIHVMLGWNKGAHAQARLRWCAGARGHHPPRKKPGLSLPPPPLPPRSLFGKVEAFVVKFELTNRGALHGHLGVFMTLLLPWILRTISESPAQVRAPARAAARARVR